MCAYTSARRQTDMARQGMQADRMQAINSSTQTSSTRKSNQSKQPWRTTTQRKTCWRCVAALVWKFSGARGSKSDLVKICRNPDLAPVPSREKTFFFFFSTRTGNLQYKDNGFLPHFRHTCHVHAAAWENIHTRPHHADRSSDVRATRFHQHPVQAYHFMERYRRRSGCARSLGQRDDDIWTS
jgi:hypothetical protein